VPDKFAQVRTKDHKVLGVVGNIYTDVSNSKAFTWADELVGGFGAHYKTAGSLYGGRVVWVLLEVPFAIKSPDGELRTMLYLRNSHDGTSKLTLGFTTVDIVCANTLAMAEASALDRVEIKHTTNAELRLKDAQQTMHLVEGAAQRAGELAEKLFASKVNNNDLTTVLNKVFPLPVFNATAERRNLTTGELRSLSIAENKRAAVVAAYNHRPALYGTKWGVYEAFSAAYQHQDIDSKDAAANERKADTIFTNIMAAKSPADEALAVLVAS
jgi:phage/plasmid-like protein (TIGR03299 family)